MELVKRHSPITGEQIAEMLNLSRPTIRSDLALLVMLGYLDAKPKVGYFLGKAQSPDAGLTGRLQEIKVKDVQGVPVALHESATINDAVVALFMENVGGLMVTDSEGLLVGVVSRKDLLKITLGNPHAATMPVNLIMTRSPNLVTVSPEDGILEAARKMLHHQVDSLPVVIPRRDGQHSGKYEAVGRISKTTMTRVLLDIAAAVKDL